MVCSAPGEMLFDLKRRFHAKFRADGSLIADGITGSIHQVGAHVQGAPACNGWAFWYHETKGGPGVDRRLAPAYQSGNRDLAGPPPNQIVHSSNTATSGAYPTGPRR